jgi:hypothetical protein
MNVKKLSAGLLDFPSACNDRLPSSIRAKEFPMLPAVSEYLSGPFKAVEGWCVPHLWQAIEPLHDLQASLGIDRPVAEIGVYHGKFLIGLVKTKNTPRGNFAIDVFDMQEFNLDGAGKGNLETLKGNFARCGIAPGQVEIERADSMAIGDAHIESILKRAGGGFSMFSVDGCHMPEHTVNDIRIAIKLTVPQGIIFVDDYYNANWPGVQEGVAKLYFSDYVNFVPLLYTSNKLFLCHISYHGRYLRHAAEFIAAQHPETRIKRVKRFGHDTLTVSPKMTSEKYLA